MNGTNKPTNKATKDLRPNYKDGYDPESENSLTDTLNPFVIQPFETKLAEGMTIERLEEMIREV
ncbi:MAG: hypothetical protein WBD27_06005 [Pyrinomonadaceae bacterium]